MRKTKCVQCGGSFQVDDTQRNWQHVKYCSDDCIKAKAAADKRAKYKSKKVSAKCCENCGRKFQPEQNIGARQKYCSKKCGKEVKTRRAREKWSDSRRKKKCTHCGKVFVPVKYAAGVQIYCSDPCQVRAIHRRHDKKNRRSGKYQQEFKVMKPAVLERDKACVLCGSEERLHVHHWDNSGRSEDCNNSLNNLAVLCGDCHSAIHKVTLAKIAGEWYVDGRIFDILDIDGPIPINRRSR